MGKNSKIEWTHHTLNLWWGCTNVHRGCDNCYAETWAKRWDNDVWGNYAPRKYVKSWFSNVLKWLAEAGRDGAIRRVFVGSMMDIFEKPMRLVDGKGNLMNRMPGVKNTTRRTRYTSGNVREYFFNEVVPACPNLMFLLLTKRPSNINKMVPARWLDCQPDNVMYGASVVDQQSAEDVARHFAKVNGNKFLSVEPLLEAVDMTPFVSYEYDYETDFADYEMKVEWVIVGGESGPSRRPFNPDWARTIMNLCDASDTAFFMKQWDKVKEVPEDLMIREFPACHELQPV